MGHNEDIAPALGVDCDILYQIGEKISGIIYV